MIIIEAHITMQPTLTALKLNIFEKKFKNSYRKQKYHKKYL